MRKSSLISEQGDGNRTAFAPPATNIKPFVCFSKLQQLSLPQSIKMKKNKRHILYLLFCISIVMLIVPVMPHHHHTEGVICMKSNAAAEHPCPVHHHNHKTCCNNECAAKWQSPIPAVQRNIAQHTLFSIILFHEPLLKLLLTPQEVSLDTNLVYLESLHGTFITRATGLRAPPTLLA